MALQKALVVDDSKLARISLRKQLQARGLEVEMVESGQDALNLLKEKAVDVVFMDHLMPNMDGFEAMHAIKANPATKGIPVIMCTGKEEPGYLQEAVANGAAGILAKPPGDEALDEAIKVAEAAKDAPAPAATEAPAAAPIEPAPAAATMAEPAAVTPNFDPELIQQLQSQVASIQSLVSSLQQQMAEMTKQVSSSSAGSAEVDTDAIASLVESKVAEAVAGIETPAVPDIDIPAIIAGIEEKVSAQVSAAVTDATANLAAPAADIDTSALSAEIEEKLSASMQATINSQVAEATSKIELSAPAAAEIDTTAIVAETVAAVEQKLSSQISEAVKQATANLEAPAAAAPEVDTAAIVAQAESAISGKLSEIVDSKADALESRLAEQLQSQLTLKLSQQSEQASGGGISEDRVKELALDIASEVVSQQPSGGGDAELSQQQIDQLLSNAVEAGRSAGQESGSQAAEQALASIDEKLAAVPASGSGSAEVPGDIKQQLESAIDSASAAKIPGIIAILLGIAAIALKFVNL